VQEIINKSYYNNYKRNNNGQAKSLQMFTFVRCRVLTVRYYGNMHHFAEIFCFAENFGSLRGVWDFKVFLFCKKKNLNQKKNIFYYSLYTKDCLCQKR